MPYQYPGYLDRPSFCDRDVTVRDDLGKPACSTCGADTAAVDRRCR